MKKQIFILVVLVLATFANVNKSFGQILTGALSCPTPRTITCLTADAMHPVAGTAYTYEVTVPLPLTGTKTFKWIVTQEQTFITNGTLNITAAEIVGGQHIFAAGNELNAVSADPAGKDISITWKAFVPDPSLPVFVVIYVENAITCTTQNLKVYKIEPVNAFTLDIANVDVSGTVANWNVDGASCFAPIASAIYSSGPDGITYDYGKNYIYYTVTAANFNTSWRPVFQLSGLNAAQTSSIDWSYSNAPTVWNAMTGAGNGSYTTAGQVDAKAVGGSVGSNGECIIIRVTILNQKFEGLAVEPITLAVDGKTDLTQIPAKQTPDVHHAGAVGVCGLSDGFANDFATHNLQPRTTITDATSDVPNPTNYLPSK